MGWRRHLPRASPARVRATRGSTWGVLRRPRQELADQAAHAAWKAWPGNDKSRGGAPRGARPRSQAGAARKCRAAAPAAHGALAMPRRFSALRSPRLGPGEKEPGPPSGGLPRGAGGLLPHLTNPLISMTFIVPAEIGRFRLRPEPNVKQPLLGLVAMWARNGDRAWR